MGFAVNGNLHDFYSNPEFSQALLESTAGVALQRGNRKTATWAALCAFVKHPGLWRPGLRWLGKTLWSARRDLWAARGRVHKLSFVVHNFMDAAGLDQERVHSCVFMVATATGMLSMCVHNAKRDDYILRDANSPPAGSDPVTTYPLKYLKGRSRERAMRLRASAHAG
jgi:hypothetical protein